MYLSGLRRPISTASNPYHTPYLANMGDLSGSRSAPPPPPAKPLSDSAIRMLTAAIVRDYQANPQLIYEAGANGSLRSLIATEVQAVVQGTSIPSLFPNLAAAVSQLFSGGSRSLLHGLGEDEAVGTNDTWATDNSSSPFTMNYDSGPSSGGVPGISTSLDTAPSSGSSSGGMVTSYSQLTPSGSSSSSGKQAAAPAQASGGDDWTKMLSSVVKSAADAGSAIFKAQTAANAANKQTSMLSKIASLIPGAKAGTSSSASILSGSTMPILLIGGGLAVASVFIMKSGSSGGKTSRRRSRRR